MNDKEFNTFLNNIMAKREYMLVVRKHVSSFIEKILRCLGHDFRHDVFKSVVYDEKPYITPEEEKWKSYYDSFMYLMLNRHSPFTTSLVKRFMYLILNKELDDSLLLKITSKAFYLDNEFSIEALTRFYMESYECLNILSEQDCFIISFMLLNYFLVRHNIPCIKLIRSDFEEYVKLRDYALSDDKIPLCNFLKKIILKSKFQLIEFNNELKPISVDEIKKMFMGDKEDLKNKYKIENIYLFGSFSKNNERVDSDIDLLIKFEEGNSFEEKHKIINYLDKYYTDKLKRYIDFGEISDMLTDDFILENKRLLKII
mgnify:CR=1 FL=1